MRSLTRKPDNLTTGAPGWHELSHQSAIRFGGLLVSITNEHIRFYGQWILNCPPYFVDRKLKAKTREQAAEEAIRLVYEQVQSTVTRLDLYCPPQVPL